MILYPSTMDLRTGLCGVCGHDIYFHPSSGDYDCLDVVAGCVNCQRGYCRQLEGKTMAKAILITEQNARALELEYDLEDEQLEGLEGFWLVADFGEKSLGKIRGYLTKVALDRTYEIVGDLENDYKELKLRA